MKTIFIITFGEYSSYRIDSVWSTRELAERHVRSIGGQIEEYLVDSGVESPRRVWWIYVRAGTVHAGNNPEPQHIEPSRMWVGCSDVLRGIRHGDGDWYIPADDEASAIKIAAERRASAMAAYATSSELDPGHWVEVEGP